MFNKLIKIFKTATQKFNIKKINSKSMFIALSILAVFVVVAGCIYLLNLPDKATVIMTMNYENSSAGLNPDGSKFNVRNFKCEDVLNQAIKNTNVENAFDSEMLTSMINIKEVAQKPIDVESDIISIDSTYKITLTIPSEYKRVISAEKMLEEICASYKEWFISNYVVDSKVLTLDMGIAENMDYMMAANYLDMIVNRGKNYLSQKEESTSAFIGSDGATWKSLRQELSNLTEYDLKTFNQYIWENGISKDRCWATTLLMYKNYDLDLNYKLLLANADTCGSVVGEYRNEMTITAPIPTFDSDEQFYMSRTKSGIDELSKSMDKYFEDASEIKGLIASNEDRIEKLEKSKITDTSKADIMMTYMIEEVTDVFQRIRKLDEEYVQEKTDDYVQYSFVDDSFLFFF